MRISAVVAPAAAAVRLSHAQSNFNRADYATSPPVYPAPEASGQGWADAFARASNFTAELTLEEKAYVVTGVTGPCTGSIKTIKRLGFNGLCLQDGPLAIRQADYASVFPAGLTVAASFDRGLARLRGRQMGAEFVGKGSHIALGPVAGPLGRSPLGGRNWEGFSPDPYLTGELFAVTVEGMEAAGVQACAKHFIANEQETQRSVGTVNGTRVEGISSNIDDRTMHEVYLWPFANAVHSGVSSVMCSYQRVNGSYACQNSKILNGLLKGELGFQGYVMSDWLGTRSGVAAIEAGLDMDMPGLLVFYDESGNSYFGANLTAAVRNGSLPEARLDDMVRRVMAPYFRLHQDAADFPGIDPAVGPLNDLTRRLKRADDWPYNNRSSVDVRADHAIAIRQLGAAGIVLLKNDNNVLPLGKPRNIAVYGNDAGDLTDGLVSTIDNRTGAVGFEYGVFAAGGGSGTGLFTDIVPPLEALKARQRQNGGIVQYVQDNELATRLGPLSIVTGTPADACLVLIKSYAAENTDRPSLSFDWNGDALVESVASHCNNTIVITHSAGINPLPWVKNLASIHPKDVPLTCEISFASHPNVTAILAAHLGGEQVGNSLVDVLYGDVNPSGHLPYTVPNNESDYSFVSVARAPTGTTSAGAPDWQSDFVEGPLIDYRHFDYYNLSVRYPFGFGLSYTTFALSDLAIDRVDQSPITALPPPATTAPGGNPTLWDVLYRVRVTVRNTGEVGGQAVPQLYLTLPGPDGPKGAAGKSLRVLRGFEKVSVEPGERVEVAFDLMRRDISYWDVVRQDWVIDEAGVDVQVGFDSRDRALTGTFRPLVG